jgi:drug/metabolite transporter (DMT)-like permease
MLWMTVIASVLSLPYGLVGLARGGIDLPALGALFMLGAVGTGIAFALYGVLLSRAGTVRGMIGIFFTPIVGTILGVAVRGDKLHAAAILGMLIVLVGAVMVSRPEPRHLGSGVEEPPDLVLPESLLEVGDQVGSALDSD